jgi:hypothetical protein
MIDETNDVKQEAVETSEVSSTPEQTTEEVSNNETPSEIKTEEVSTEQTETGDSPKKGASERIRELNARAKEAEAKAQSLAQKLEELTGSTEPKAYEPYQPQVEPGSEIGLDQYKQDVMRTADSLVSLRIKQQETLGKINNDAQNVIKKYPQLDPDSDTFDKDLSDSITEAVEAHVKADPYKASVGQFVDRLMKPYTRAVNKEVGQVTEKLAKQVSETALRPTQNRVVEKTTKDKSIAELEAELGVVQV